MKKQIKFRVWDKEHKEMIYDISLSTINFYGSLNCFFENTEIMQFSGLKDKNGKDIYEGDFLNYKQHKECGNWASEWCFDNDYKITVQFKNGMFCGDYDKESLYKTIAPLRAGEITQWEIVGNIFESQEFICKHEILDSNYHCAACGNDTLPKAPETF